MNKIIVPPKCERARILEENQTFTIGGHKEITKTYNRIKGRYYWNNMKADVHAYIQNCRACQLKKLVRVKTKQPMILTYTLDSTFDKISMDIMGPLPTTQADNTYILTIQDLLTKFSLPLRRANAIDVADTITNKLICIFGSGGST